MSETEENQDSARSRSLKSRFARLSFFNILANLSVPLASLIDTALLGHLPDIVFLAGVALGIVMFDYVYWTFGFLRMATTGLVAQAHGQGNREEVRLVLYRSLILAGSIGLLLIAAAEPLRELGFRFLHGAPEVERAGRAYFDARILSAPATLANFAFLGWFLGREESFQVLMITVTGGVVNIVSSYLLIAHFGLAAYGAGLGTTISQYAMVLLSLVIYSRYDGEGAIKWRQVWSPNKLWSLFRLNRDILFRTLALITTFAIFTNISSLLGTVVLAANAVLLRFLTLAAYFVDGAAFATESLAGVAYGRRDFGSLEKLRRHALRFGLALTVPFVVIFLLVPKWPIRLLVTQEGVVDLASQSAIWLALTILCGSVAYIYDGYFLGLTAGRELRNAMLLSTLAVFLPGTWLALRLESNLVLWWSMIGFMVIRSLTLHKSQRGLAARLQLDPLSRN